MNFFSHFIVDHQPNNPAYNVALIMPDLLRNFTPNHCKFNFAELYNRSQLSLTNSNIPNPIPHPNQTHIPNQHPITLGNFFLGCLQHIERDKHFHSSEFFTNAYNLLRKDWRAACLEYEIPKYWFSLHVLIEIMLDKYFIDNNLIKLSLFYTQLQEEQEIFEKALNIMHHPAPHEFMNRYHKFCEHQYLYQYQHIEKITFALHRIYIQIGIPTHWYQPNHEKITAILATQYRQFLPLLQSFDSIEIQRNHQSKQ